MLEAQSTAIQKMKLHQKESKTCWAHYVSQAVWKVMHKTISANLLCEYCNLKMNSFAQHMCS